MCLVLDLGAGLSGHQFENQVPGLLGDPVGGRVGGDAQDMDAAVGVLDDGEAVEVGQCDRVGVTGIARQDPGRLSAQELAPARSGPSRSRGDAGPVQDPPIRGSTHRTPWARDRRLARERRPTRTVIGDMKRPSPPRDGLFLHDG